MIKRILVGIILAITIGGAAIFYYLNKPEPLVDSVFRAVPLDAALLIDIKNYYAFNSNFVAGKPLWDHVSKLPLFDDVDKRLRFIDSLTHIYPQLQALLSEKHSLLISGHPTGKDEIQYVYYLKVDEESDFKQFDKLIQGLEGKALEYATRKYEGVAIHDISFATIRDDNFSYLWSHGLLILSKSSILLEKAIRQLSAQESLLEKQGLNQIVKTAGKTALANFYLNFEYFPAVAQKLIHVKFRRELQFIKKFGSWVELDLNVKPDVLILNGFSISDVAKPSFESLFKNQQPQKLEVFSKIPSNANTFAMLGISKFSQYMIDYELLLESDGSSKSYKLALKNIKDTYNIDLISSFNDIFDQEAGVVFLNSINDTLSHQAFSIIQTKSGDDAEKMLNGFADAYANKNNLKASDLIEKEKVGNNQELKIWSLPFANIPACLFGKMFSAGDNQFCALIDNYLVFGSNRDALIQYYKYLDQNTTLGTDLEFNNFSEFFSTQSNFFFYNRPSVSMGFYANFLKSELTEKLALQQMHLNTMNTMVYQFNSGENGLIYHNFFLKYNSSATKTANETLKLSNEIQLDAKIISKPTFYKNPSSKEVDVFVQDEKNQVYLINNLGRILWKTKLPEPIISDVFQIDFFKNGKQQLLFNTRSKLYIIDKNGNSVEKFPVTLPKPATNGLALVDYEKNRDYRIFIAGNDHQIYAFDKKGEPLKKWDPEKTESDVTQPLQHFHIAGKDFLVFNDRNHLYVVDRKGKGIIKPVEPFQISVNNKFALINPRSRKEAKFVITNKNGKVILIGLDGKAKEMDFGKYTENHWFDVDDVDGDGVKDFIFAWDHNLKVFSQDGKALFTITLNSPITCRPIFYELSKNEFSLGLVTGGDEKIYIYNKTGDLRKGFPLKGNTQFSMDALKNSENRYNLMIGSGNNLLCQYSVQ